MTALEVADQVRKRAWETLTPARRADLGAVEALLAESPPTSAWHPDAACRTGEAPPDRWYPEGGQTGAQARQVCETKCPVRLQCLAQAVRDDERHGIWGGASWRQIEAMRIALGLAEMPGSADDNSCANDHEWTTESLRWTDSGRPVCRICIAAQGRAARARRQVARRVEAATSSLVVARRRHGLTQTRG